MKHLLYAYLVIYILLCVPARAHDTPNEKPNDKPNKNTLIGTSASEFSLPDVQGRQVDLRAYRGKTLVLNFCAFWCDTWKAEWPHLKELEREEDELHFSILVVSVDGTRLQEYLRFTHGSAPFPVLLDVGGAVSRSYAIAHVPTVFVIAPDGTIRAKSVGYPGNAALRHQIQAATK